MSKTESRFIFVALLIQKC